MVSKISNNVLLVIFAVLAGLFLIMYFSGGKSERSFHDQLVDIDTVAVNKIQLYPKSNNHKEVTLIKTDETWKVLLGNKSAMASPGVVDNMLSELIKMKPKKMASRKESKWSEFQVDTAGTRVKVFEDGSLAADVIVGKIKFQQPRSVSTYIRLSGETDVFEVEGFLEMIFNKSENNLRDSRIISSDPAKWQSVAFDYPGDSSFSLLKVNGKWQSDQMLPDSAQTDKTLKNLAYITGTAFIDNITPSQLTDQAFKVTVDPDTEESIVVTGYKLNDRIIINSSLNPDSYFDGSESGLKEKLMLNNKDFEKSE